MAFGINCHAEGVSGSFGVTNNYVARGTSQTYKDEPSYLVNLNYDYKGFYFGTFVANVDFGEEQIKTQSNPTYQEIDFWAGYRKSLGNNTLDFMIGSYNYLGDTFTALDMVEAKVAFTIPLNKQFSLTTSLGVTPDYFNILGKSVWVDSMLAYQANDKFNFSVGLGRQFIPDKGGSNVMPYLSDGYSYTTWNAGGTYIINKNLSLDLRFSDTDRHDLGSVFERNAYGVNFSATIKYNF